MSDYVWTNTNKGMFDNPDKPLEAHNVEPTNTSGKKIYDNPAKPMSRSEPDKQHSLDDNKGIFNPDKPLKPHGVVEPDARVSKPISIMPPPEKMKSGDHHYQGAGDAGAGDAGAGLDEFGGDAAAAGQFGYDVAKNLDPNINKQFQHTVDKNHLGHLEKTLGGAAKQVSGLGQEVYNWSTKHLGSTVTNVAANMWDNTYKKSFSDLGNLWNDITQSSADVATHTQDTKAGVKQSNSVGSDIVNVVEDAANAELNTLTDHVWSAVKDKILNWL